jgi:hypothetical protein
MMKLVVVSTGGDVIGVGSAAGTAWRVTRHSFPPTLGWIVNDQRRSGRLID